MSTQNTVQPEQDSRLAKLQWYGRVCTVATVLLAIVGLLAVYWVTTRQPQTDDAEIFANYIGIAPVVEGPILHLNVADNQQVKRGDLLFEIDDRPYKYALDRSVSDQATLEGEVDEGVLVVDDGCAGDVDVALQVLGPDLRVLLHEGAEQFYDRFAMK